ncbi:peptidylprolyl isomerase [Aequorivita lipolytica]|uniref:Peptidyl-prolyl cis-trans isomerase n=1 Tax=Aequorivita lipolytica TaxID=153267 RepID=A0A5C6YPU8_9FLAO|nr:peptidylprolyl isomerase [Aequorivita lipolytica]TXD69590.1 peptidylprolyl isomerase [Aequorivita lipolytica]SRX51076.1 Peptidyl-prolyl cis-trans isomerase A [Aequorivita lipolytica]
MGKLFIYLFGIVLFFGSCEDNKKASDADSNRDEIEIENEIEIEKQSITENEAEVDSIALKHPEITNENVVSFLTEYGKNNPETKVLITSRFGDIEMELYKDTPLHRANFIYLVKQHYFDETFFHRVVPNFIIQAGNSDIVSTPRKRAALGNDYLLPAEIIQGRVHEYGTVSGAKEYRENPDNRTAPYEFFIFLGPKSSTTHLNGKYTIFGKVTKGMDIVEEISKVKADDGDWPLNNIYITAKVIE